MSSIEFRNNGTRDGASRENEVPVHIYVRGSHVEPYGGGDVARRKPLVACRQPGVSCGGFWEGREESCRRASRTPSCATFWFMHDKT